MVFCRPLRLCASLRLCVKITRSRCGTQRAQKLRATGFERINRNGLATEKAQNQLLMEAIPEKRYGLRHPLMRSRSPLPSVLVDPFNSVARRFSAPPRANVGSLVRCRSFQSRSHEMARGSFHGARKPERHEIAITRAIPAVACAPAGQALSACSACVPLAAG
jgi:hypothetical protein